MVQKESHSYARLLVEATMEAADRCELDPPHWDESGEHEGTYCFDCAEKLFPDDIDGGYTWEEEAPPACENCSVPLDFTFTDYGVEEQLDYFEEHGIRTDHDAYCLHRMLNAGGNPLLTEQDYHPEWQHRLRAIYESLTRKPLTATPDTRSPTYEELLAFVESQPCECHDEYGKPMPQPCDRCQVLKQDNRDVGSRNHETVADQSEEWAP